MRYSVLHFTTLQQHCTSLHGTHCTYCLYFTARCSAIHCTVLATHHQQCTPIHFTACDLLCTSLAPHSTLPHCRVQCTSLHCTLFRYICTCTTRYAPAPRDAPVYICTCTAIMTPASSSLHQVVWRWYRPKIRLARRCHADKYSTSC